MQPCTPLRRICMLVHARHNFVAELNLSHLPWPQWRTPRSRSAAASADEALSGTRARGRGDHLVACCAVLTLCLAMHRHVCRGLAQQLCLWRRAVLGRAARRGAPGGRGARSVCRGQGQHPQARGDAAGGRERPQARALPGGPACELCVRPRMCMCMRARLSLRACVLCRAPGMCDSPPCTHAGRGRSARGLRAGWWAAGACRAAGAPRGPAAGAGGGRAGAWLGQCHKHRLPCSLPRGGPPPPASVGAFRAPPTTPLAPPPPPHDRCWDWWAARASACCCCGRQWNCQSFWASLQRARWRWRAARSSRPATPASQLPRTTCGIAHARWHRCLGRRADICRPYAASSRSASDHSAPPPHPTHRVRPFACRARCHARGPRCVQAA